MMDRSGTAYNKKINVANKLRLVFAGVVAV
jgi:hypothetical protein